MPGQEFHDNGVECGGNLLVIRTGPGHPARADMVQDLIDRICR